MSNFQHFQVTVEFFFTVQSVLQGLASCWGVKCCITEGRCQSKVLLGFFFSFPFLPDKAQSSLKGLSSTGKSKSVPLVHLQVMNYQLTPVF